MLCDSIYSLRGARLVSVDAYLLTSGVVIPVPLALANAHVRNARRDLPLLI
jgi:hypothetical protein